MLTVCPRTPYQGRRLALCVLSRAEVAHRTFDRPYAVISIGDPGSCPARLADSPHFQASLHLFFQDTDHFADPLAMTPADATRVVAFVERQLPGIELLVVNCEQGIRRSAGLAAAVSLWLNGEDEWFYRHFCPNRLVRRLVLEAAQAVDPAVFVPACPR